MIPELETGGAERTAVDIAVALAARGDRAIVLSQGGGLVEELEAAGGEHIAFPAKTKNPLALVNNAFRLASMIRRENIELIHARSRAPAWSALMAARMTGIPFVTTYHGLYGQKSRLKGLYNSVMARGDVVIANSHYTADIIAKRHAFAAGRIEVVHRGSDLEAFAGSAENEARGKKLLAAWGVDENSRVILNVARLTWWKGQRVLIDALADLARDGKADWVAVLAGSDQGREDYRRELEERILSAGLEKRVKLVGHCADIPAAHAAADIAVIASIEPEAFGRAAVEAQASGVPVIATDLGAAPETVLAPPQVAEEERTGYRVPPGDAAALANALRKVLSLGAGEREALVRRAADHAAANFSMQAMCRTTLALYDRLLEKAL
ncbi:glycosyltransferase [Stappia sp. GBMRC 2046]|uniref:Glycosyltransferase n=1 Tax=Stappia sediminis TaxID=2692190 RepID=A0A7X3S919_9HYPH|nr:glycosyltransferase [Stappia sediminis]